MKALLLLGISKIIISLSLLHAPAVMAQTADLILTNGKIFTADSSELYIEALAIKGEKIIATGANAAIEKLATSQTKIIDLKGKTVVPGFNDAHDHVGWTAPIGLKFNQIDETVPGPGKAAVLDSIARIVSKAKPDQWIHGRVGLIILRDTSMRTALDSIAPDNPVVLESWWGHGMAVNSKALDLAGIGDADPDPPGGSYGRNTAADKLNGLLDEYAQAPIWNTWVTSEPENLIKSLRDYAQEQIEWGITSVQNINGLLGAEEATRFYKEADLPLHTRILLWPYSYTSPSKEDYLKHQKSRPNPMTYISGVKYIIDGSPIEQNALMKKPYEGRPEWYGQLNFPEDTIRNILSEAINSDTQLLLHIVGDSTLSIVLSLMKDIAPPKDWRKKRVRIEHNSIELTSDYLEQIKRLGLLMMHTPIYAGQSLLKTLVKSGVRVGIAPDHAMNPFLNIQLVTTQMSRESENLTREEAVIIYTLGNAFAEFAEQEKGTLTKGKQADLAVLSEDIFTIPAENLMSTKSLLTIVKGKIVYQAVEF